MNIISHGIKCDNTNCDWNDESIPTSQFIDWLNKPCPKCGENLLTEEDYNSYLIFVKKLEEINELYPPKEGEELYHSVYDIHNGIHLVSLEKVDQELPENYIAKEMEIISDLLEEARKEGMEVEVVTWALYDMKNNSSLSPSQAISCGFNEWIK
jgi:hypothetical protein